MRIRSADLAQRAIPLRELEEFSIFPVPLLVGSEIMLISALWLIWRRGLCFCFLVG